MHGKRYIIQILIGSLFYLASSIPIFADEAEKIQFCLKHKISDEVLVACEDISNRGQEEEIRCYDIKRGDYRNLTNIINWNKLTKEDCKKTRGAMSDTVAYKENEQSKITKLRDSIKRMRAATSSKTDLKVQLGLWNDIYQTYSNASSKEAQKLLRVVQDEIDQIQLKLTQ